MIFSEVLPANWRDVFTEDRKIGIGVDPATTTKKKSNPTAIAVIQQVGLSYFVRLLLRFKTSDDRVTTEILREIATGLPRGLRVRKICILATNERFYAGQLKRALAGTVPVEPVIESESTVYLGEKMSIKAYLGNQLLNQLDDGYLPLPDESWVKADLRQTERSQGTFIADPDENGNHADGFCAIGAGLHALIGAGGPAEAAAMQVGSFGAACAGGGRKLRNPFASKFEQRGTLIHV